MNRVALFSMLLAVAGCGFAQKHPAVTIGITAGIVGFGACGMAVEKLDTCSAIGAAAGVGLGGIAGLAMLLADSQSHDLPPFDEDDQTIQSGTPPPPGLPIDAGVPIAPGEQGAPGASLPPPGASLPPPGVPADAGVAPMSADAGAAP